MTDASRTQGWAICIGAGALAFLFLIGLVSGSYLALAIPVAVLVFFVLGLAGWVGFTIATIQVEPEALPDPPPRESEEVPAEAADASASPRSAPTA